jgi:thiol-disulfide isomerase/thioredoxin
LHRCNLQAVLLLAISVFVVSNFWINVAWAQSQDVTVKVIDGKDAPLLGVEVEIFEYFGGLKPTPFKGETNAEGEVRFEGVSLQGHAYLVARHTDFAPVIHFLPIAGQDNVTTTIRLAPATNAFVDVYSPDGKPLMGVEVTRLEFSSELTGEKHFANHDFFMAMMQNDGSPYQSDAKGRLHFPPLPSDAVLSITVTHPGYSFGEIKDIKASEVTDAKIELKKGTTVEAYLVGDPDVVKKLEGERVRIKTSDREKGGLNHSFQVQNGKFEFSLVPGRYDSLYVSGSPDLVITPTLPSSNRLAEFARVPDLDRIQKNFVVRDLHTVKGRVVTSNGTPVSDLMLSVEYENLYVDEEGKEQVVDEHPTADGIVTTNHEGKFECRVPKGNTSISAWWTSGYYSYPDKLEFVYESQSELPDYVVRPMPIIKGTAVNEEGNPVSNAILRLVDHTNNYIIADLEGRFEVPVSILDYDDEGKSKTNFKTLSAFDLGSRLCCMESIDITNEEAITNLQLELKSHPVDWLLNHLAEKSDQRLERMLASSNYMSEEIKAHEKRQEEIQANNRFAPDLADGKWLKDIGSRSLSEYRGKYVLLDFWFIGCGPCEREIPNLKLAHQKFKDRSFSVIGIHIAGRDSEIVEKFMSDRAMDYPMVIDRFDEPIMKAYEPLGLEGYPMYFLINPDGEIDWDAAIRGQMLETIRDRILKLDESKSGR